MDSGQSSSGDDAAGGVPPGTVPPFERFRSRDAADLIAAYPLAWLCARGAGADGASLLPLLAETNDSGKVVALIGHMARWNRLFETLSRAPSALILFQGPHGYVSPEHVGRRDWVPTWNYAQLRVEAEIRFQPEGGDAALAMLVDAMEAGRADPWRAEETGARYRSMEQAIIAFRADISALHGRFKLGQDETPETLRAIVANHPDPALVGWMKRFNEGRY